MDKKFDVEGIAFEFDNEQEVGVENLKKVIQVALKAKRKITRYLQDGRVNAFEGVGISLTVLGSLRLVPLWPQIRSEFFDLDEEELNELVALVAPDFNVSAELASEYLSGFIDLMDAIRAFFN